MRDFQKARVYAWEDAEIGPRDKTAPVPFERAPMLVSGVWLALGLVAPPRIEPLSGRVTRTLARGSRIALQLSVEEPTPTWIILHETAHALTSTHDGDVGSDHGPVFVGMYMQLLERFLAIPIPLLIYTASRYGVAFDLSAKPVFLDRD